MAKLNELATRLLARFRDVPNVTLEDTTEWATLAMNEHGYTSSDDVPAEYTSLILLFAEADGASQIALRTAWYFSYGDRDETVDKSKTSEQYRKLADDLYKRYRRKKDEGVGDLGGSSFFVMRRADRR